MNWESKHAKVRMMIVNLYCTHPKTEYLLKLNEETKELKIKKSTTCLIVTQYQGKNITFNKTQNSPKMLDKLLRKISSFFNQSKKVLS